MSKYQSTLRAWLLAALCGVAAVTSSCQREAEDLRPATEQASGGALTLQERNAVQQAFAASGYTSELRDENPDRKTVRQWQPQWEQAFSAQGAVYVPLLFTEGNTALMGFANAKHFLVKQGTTFSLAMYVFPHGQSASQVANSPAFMHAFTGKLALRQLGASRVRLSVYDQGRAQAAPKAGTSGSDAPEACYTATTCFWEGRCYPGDFTYLDITEGRDGCEEPDTAPCGSAFGYWFMYDSYGYWTCQPDPDPDPDPEPDPGNYQNMPDGWYKITAVHSGLVLDVYGGSTADGAQVIQWFDQGSDNQKWYVKFYGRNSGSLEVYTLTPYSNYLVSGLSQSLSIYGFTGGGNGPAPTAGTPVKIWSPPSMGPYDPMAQSPFTWSFNYDGIRTAGGNTGQAAGLRNHYSGLYLDVQDAGMDAGRPVQQWPMNGTRPSTNQSFIFTPVQI